MRLNLNREAAFTRQTALTKAEVLAKQSSSYNANYSLAHLQLGNIYLARAEPIVAQIADSLLVTATEYPQAKIDVTDQLTSHVNHYLYGPMNYAIVARKPDIEHSHDTQ